MTGKDLAMASENENVAKQVSGSKHDDITAVIRDLAEKHFGKVRSCELLGTATHKVVLADGTIIKARWSGTSDTDVWLRQQLDHIPKVLLTVDLEDWSWGGNGRVLFIEWWEGKQFPVQLIDVHELHPDLFYKYGEFIKQMKWRSMHVKDETWKNVVHSSDRDMVFNCDIHRMELDDRGYLDIIKRRVTDEQWEAFQGGLVTTRTDLTELADKMKKGWMGGRHYQPVDVADIHIPGKRSAYRFDLMQLGSLEGKSVVDFGCSLGQCCFEAARLGADYVMGIDNAGVVPYKLTTWLNSLADYADYDHKNLNFQAFDLDKKIDWQHFLSLEHQRTRHNDCDKPKWDIVFCFAVIRHVKQSERLMKYIEDNAGMMYFEGQLSETQEQVENAIRRYTTFTSLEYLGNASEFDYTPCVRHLYRCTR